MVLAARVTAIIAAITWLIGAPLVALEGVPFPSDAQYLVEGTIAVVLGLALIPVTLVIGNPLPFRTRAFVRVSGLAACIALVASGVALVLAVQGRFGERAPHFIPDTAVVVFVTLFAWIAAASVALRGPSTIERWRFWLGLLTGSSCVAPVLASILIFYLARDFVVTNSTVLPLFLVDLLIWVCLPAWLTAVAISL